MRPTNPNAKLEHAQAAATRVVDVHKRLVDFLRPGVTLAQIDTFVGQVLDDLGAKSCFKGYKVPRCPAFPSFSCLSPNDCIVHGTAGFRREPLVEGDTISIDIGVKYHGWIGDAAWTYYMGSMSDDQKRLCAAGRESIDAGIAQLVPGKTYTEFARAVQDVVETRHGLHCVRGLGGHGYSQRLHEPPFIANSLPSFPGEWPDAHTKVKTGTLLAVEPMIAVGTPEISQEPGTWPIYTADGSLSVHYEHDVYIGEDGPVVLTEELAQLPDVVGD
ncbi:MAG: type I methionyl aminopeptidase [Phycisphaerales bacterium JB043]